MRLIPKIILAVLVGLAIIALLASGATQLLGKLASPDGATIVSVLLRNHHSTAIPVTVVDIDDRTYQAWGSPLITPRETLFSLIEKVSALAPLAIVVDIDLAATPARDGVGLATFIDRRTASEVSSPQTPPLLLARRLSPDEKGNDAAARLPAIHPGLETTVRDTANVKWVSALVTPEDDATIRKWRAFHALCAETPPRALPSSALAVEVLRRGGLKDYAALEQRLALEAAKVCSGSPSVSGPDHLRGLIVPGYAIPVPYMFGWSSGTDPYFQTTDTVNGRRPLLIRVSARDVEAARALSRDSFEGRVVVIGASHSDSQDFRRTPLGTMPGVYILANTVAGARDMLDARFSPRTSIFLFAAPLFLLCAFVGVTTRSIAGIPIVVVIVLLSVTIGLLLEMPPFAIHEGAIAALGALVVTLALLRAWQFLSRIINAEKVKPAWSDLFLSDAGKWLYGRLSQRRTEGAK
jgi:CHASE2 domain-containing sensor protein